MARLHAAASVNEAYLGDSQHARADVDAALKLDPNRDRAVASGLIWRCNGAERVAAELDRDYPQDTGVRHYYLPAMRAAVALQGKHPDEAVEALGELRPPRELGTLMSLDTIYLRGQAYLRLHNGSAAATEFQKIIDHPGLVGFYPVGALVHLGLGRAYALQGDAAKALVAYKEFLTLWKDADPDIPILKEAKAEYAKLK